VFRCLGLIILFMTEGYPQTPADTVLDQYRDSLSTSLQPKKVWYAEIALLYLRKREYDSADVYYRKALEYPDWKEEYTAYLWHNLGVVNYRLGKMDSAIHYYSKARLIYRKNNQLEKVAHISVNLGMIDKERGLYDKALENLLDGARYLANTNDKRALSSCWNTIANVYTRQRDYELALRYHHRALSIREQLGLDQLKSSSWNNIGAVYSKLEKYDSALNYYRLALEWKERNDNKRLGSTLNNIGLILLEQGELGDAETYLRRSWDQHIATGDKEGQAIVMTNMARLHHGLGSLQKALSNSRQAALMISELGLLEEMRENLEVQLAIQEDLGITSQAFATLKQLTIVKDSLLNRDKVRALMEMQTRYETERKEHEIQLLTERQALQETEIKLRNTWNKALVIIIALIFLIAVLVWGRWKRERRLRYQIETLMQELHHRIKNNLNLLSSIFSLQSRGIKDKDALELVKGGESRVRAMSLIHQNLYARRGSRTINMHHYLTELVRGLTESYGYNSATDKITTQIDNIDLDVDKAIPLGLIMNELISNAFKYAFPRVEAPKLLVRLQQRTQLELEIKDNGPGFKQCTSEKTMGLRIVEVLVRQLKAKHKLTTDGSVHFSMQLLK